MVAELLGLPQVNVVTKLEIEGAKGTAHREIEGALEKSSFSLPAVISAQKGLNEPRYETLKGIMMAKKKEIPVLTFEDLELKEEDIAPLLEVTKMESPPPRQAGKVIEEEPEAAAKKMVEYLHNEAKVI
jgi:electron transfer flavoprotein beta subunit